MSETRTYGAVDITRPARITLHLYRDDTQDITVVLPDENQFTILERGVTDMENDATRLEASDKEADKERAATLRAVVASTREKIAGMRASTESLLSSATALTYTLRLPSAGRVIALQEEATAVDPKTGLDVFNATRFNRSLFKGVIYDADNASEVSPDALPYQVYDALQQRFSRMMSVDQERVYFLSRASST